MTAQPYKSSQQNYVEMVNEQIIFFLGTLAMCLIGMTPTFEAREIQGQFVTGILALKLGFNAFRIFFSMVRQFKSWCKKRAQKKKEQKKKKEEEKELKVHEE